MSSSGRIDYRTHRYRLRPTSNQRAQMLRAAGVRRWSYNWGLEQWRLHYARHGSSPPRGLLSRELTRLKAGEGFEWLRHTHSAIPQQALSDLEKAFQHFFRGRSGYPKFRSKRTATPTFRQPSGAKLDGNRLFVPGIGWVRAKITRRPRGNLGSVTVKREPGGSWYATLVERFPATEPHLPPHPRVIGVDLGLIDLAVTSDGFRAPAPRFGRRAAQRLRRCHRAYSRGTPGSARQAKRRVSLAKAHSAVAHQRRDYLHKLTHGIVDRGDVIALEQLSVAGLARTNLARSISDAALAEMAQQIEYKTRWKGKVALRVGRFFPSSRLCSGCGALLEVLERSQREWTCRCGQVNDRDLNAAINIRDEAENILRGRGAHGHDNARGDRIRLRKGAPVAEAGTATSADAKPVRFWTE